MKLRNHTTNAWGRIKYRIVDAPKPNGDPCFEIRYADDNTMTGWATSRDEAGRYIEGTLEGVVVDKTETGE